MSIDYLARLPHKWMQAGLEFGCGMRCQCQGSVSSMHMSETMLGRFAQYQKRCMICLLIRNPSFVDEATTHWRNPNSH